ncbi:hypothetical protein DFJ77DRAFT_479422 [Powellomyces hirtus]|nr:hypothetical protein DFJ77DRAFT_479422 [Powellomyces hirtus]
MVLPLELAKSQQIALLYTINGTWQEELYKPHLLVASLAYRFILDLTFCAYSLWIVHQSAKAFESTQSGRSQTAIRQDKALFVVYTLRMVLCLAGDTAYIAGMIAAPRDDDISVTGLGLWRIYRLAVPWKPYLLITDMARVRAMSEEKKVEGATRRGGWSSQ